MPALGCNYSPQLMTLLRERRVGIDWIKLSRWETFGDDLGIARPIRPVLLHVLPRAGILPPLQPSWDELNTAVEACGSPHVALHLEARRTDWEAPMSDREVIERMVAVTTEWAMHMPFLVQVALVIFLIEFGQYWMHRLMHNISSFLQTNSSCKLKRRTWRNVLLQPIGNYCRGCNSAYSASKLDARWMQ